MAFRALHLLVLILACSYLVSLNAIRMPRLSKLPTQSPEIVASKSMNQNQMTTEDTIEDAFIEGRMDIEKNDYGPPSSNPIHTPRPPRT